MTHACRTPTHPAVFSPPLRPPISSLGPSINYEAHFSASGPRDSVTVFMSRGVFSPGVWRISSPRLASRQVKRLEVERAIIT